MVMDRNGALGAGDTNTMTRCGRKGRHHLQRGRPACGTLHHVCNLHHFKIPHTEEMRTKLLKRKAPGCCVNTGARIIKMTSDLAK